MDARARFKLLFGPYEPPVAKRGYLVCERRGKVPVGSYSQARIPWPRRYRTNSLILCGDLVRAVREESVQAVAYHWGVSVGTVSQWRRLLGVPAYNLGTSRLNAAWRKENVRYRLQAAIKKTPFKKSRKIEPDDSPYRIRYPARSAASQRRIRREGTFHNLRQWSRAEERLLGTMSDIDVARRIGRTRMAVSARRHLLNIPNFTEPPRPWLPKEEALLGTMPDIQLARRIGRSTAAVASRRDVFRIPKFDSKVRPWLPSEVKLLGRISDAEIARRFKRTRHAVQSKRVKIGKLLRDYHSWSANELALLGTAPDAQIAKRLRRSLASIGLQRRRLGIPSVIPPPVFTRWTKRELALFGRKSDSDIADLTGRSIQPVRLKRLSLGVAPIDPRYKAWTAKDTRLLGKLPDRVVAYRLKRTVLSIQMKRRKHRHRQSRATARKAMDPPRRKTLGHNPRQRSRAHSWP